MCVCFWSISGWFKHHHAVITIVEWETSTNSLISGEFFEGRDKGCCFSPIIPPHPKIINNLKSTTVLAHTLPLQPPNSRKEHRWNHAIAPPPHFCVWHPNRIQQTGDIFCLRNVPLACFQKHVRLQKPGAYDFFPRFRLHSSCQKTHCNNRKRSYVWFPECICFSFCVFFHQKKKVPLTWKTPLTKPLSEALKTETYPNTTWMPCKGAVFLSTGRNCTPSIHWSTPQNRPSRKECILPITISLGAMLVWV